MSFKTVEGYLGSAVANGGTIVVAYPGETNPGTFTSGAGHYLLAIGGKFDENDAAGISTSFGASSITVTYNGATTIPAGARFVLQFNEIGDDDGEVDPLTDVNSTVRMPLLAINLGAPDTADTDAFVKAATGTEAPNTETVSYTPATDGTSPTDGVGAVVTFNGESCWKLDVPRNILTTVTHGSSVVAMTISVHGYDEYGDALSETITVAATGTSQVDNGLKAFKYVSQIDLTAAADAEANTVNVGFGDVLGLPFFLPAVGHVIKELEDGAAPTAGTVVAGVKTTPSATTGDVRGTYDPNSACDGSKAFVLLVAASDVSYRGHDNYAA